MKAKQTEYVVTEDSKARVEQALGCTTCDWEVRDGVVRFRTHAPVTLKALEALSVELGTDAINFSFGAEGCPGYSEVTPSSPAEPGYIEVILVKKG